MRRWKNYFARFAERRAGALVRGQFLLGGEWKSPRKILQAGSDGIELGELRLIKSVAGQNGPEQLPQLPELMSGDGVAIGKLARHQLCAEGLTTADCAAGAGV